MAIGVGLKNGEAGLRQLAGGCMEGREKWRMFFILELGPYVEMTSEMEFLTFAHTLYYIWNTQGHSHTYMVSLRNQVCVSAPVCNSILTTSAALVSNTFH